MNANMPKRQQANYLGIGSIGICLLLSAPSLFGTAPHHKGMLMDKPIGTTFREPPPSSYTDTTLAEVVVLSKKGKNSPEIVWDEDDPFQPVAPIPEFIEEEHSIEDLRTCELGGIAWQDLNYDGIKEAGDPALAGIMVRLLSHTGDIIATTHSDAKGRYHFKGIQAGDYHISFDPGNSGLSYGTQANQTGGLLSDTQDSDIGSYSYRTPAFHLDKGESLQNINGGFVGKPLIAELSDFRLTDGEDGVSVAWLTLSERNTHSFEVERSLDGKQFESLGELPAAGFSMKARGYNWTDTSANAGLLHYRIKQTDAAGQYQYSKVLLIQKAPPPPTERKRVSPEMIEGLLGISLPKGKGYLGK